MECKLKKAYLIKWYDLVSVASADIECDIEEIEDKLTDKTSLFYTGKLAKDEVIVEKNLLDEIDKGVRTPQRLAKDNYVSILKKHNIVIEVLKEEMAGIGGDEEKIHRNKPKEVVNLKEETNVESHDQLSLFG